MTLDDETWAVLVPLPPWWDIEEHVALFVVRKLAAARASMAEARKSPVYRERERQRHREWTRTEAGKASRRKRTMKYRSSPEVKAKRAEYERRRRARKRGKT